MKPSEKFAPYRRAEFLKGVPPARRALAERLCALLESAFDPKDIAVYAGFPIVVRDMEWIAGFAMRAAGPVAYCCSPATLAEMGDELKPYMSGKSCIAVKPRKGETIDEVLELVGRAFATASRHGGLICKADARKRERLRAVAAAGAEAAAVGSSRAASSKPQAPATRKSTKPQASAKPKSTKSQASAKRSTTRQAAAKRKSATNAAKSR